MKRIITLLVLLTTSLFYAQTTGITYQAVIYNPTGEILPGNNNQNAVLANKDICLRFSIKDAKTNLEYQETQKVKTDEFGMVNVVIGQGDQIGGYSSNFDAILWNSTTKKLQVEMDTTGNCSVFIEVSDQDFSAVPFAYASKTAENVSGIVAIANGGTGASTVVGAKTNLGLNNVDNTSDANKPVSTATQTALNAKENTIASGTTAQYYRGDKSWQTLDKTAVGLGNVNNTTDADKPVSTATQTALNAKENTIASGTTAQYYRGDKSWQTLDKATVGLGNVSNTTDADKPVSTATQTALNAKENTIAVGTTTQYYRGDKSWQTLDKTAVGLGNVNNTADADKPVSTATQTALDAKEAAANKSANPALGTSDDLFPTQKAVKTYVDNQISAGVVDATATAKGKIQLTGDLGGTADAPLVPELEFKAPLDSPQFTGTPSLPTGTVAVTQAANNNSTAVATTAYVTNALSTANSNARSNDLDMAGNSISNAFAIRAGNFQMVDEVLHPFFGGNDPNSVTIINRNNNVTQFVDGRTGSPILAITNSVNEDDEFGTPTPEEGKIGIGTTTPSEKLQVIGNIKSQSFIKENGTAGQFLKADGSVDANTYLTTTSATGTYEPIIIAGTTSQYLRGDKTFQTLDKAAVGLGNVSNTADADKPVSTATQTALNAKENTVASGTTAQYYRGDKSWQTLDKAAVGLGNVSNTTDADKPVSNDTQAALNLKANLASPTFTGDPKAVTATTGDNDTSVATTAFVSTAITNAATPVATISDLGKIQLGGDLAGTGSTAAAPVITVGAITVTKLGNDAVEESKIKNGSVTTTKIADNAVTNAKLGEIVSVNKGGTGSNMTTTSGYVKQATAGANLSTVSSIPVADVAGAVSSVNGVTPVDGNVSVLLGRVFQGVQVDPTQANSIINVNTDTNLLNNTKESDIYIVVGNSDSANNGRTFIFNGTTWLEVAINLVSTDPRYVNTTGDTMEGDLTVPTGKKIILTDVPSNATDAANKAYVDGLITPDATASQKGKIKLTGDLGGTADAPTVATNAITSAKILDGTIATADLAAASVTNAKIGETITVANGGTGAGTLTGYVKGTGTTAMTASLTIPVADVTGAQTSSNLSNDIAADTGSESKYPSVKAVETVVTSKIGGSGTTNFIPKFTATSTLGNSSIFDNGTNVGIGTSSPTSTLHIENSLLSTNTVNANAKVLSLSRPPTTDIKWNNVANFNLGSYAVVPNGGNDAAHTRLDLTLNDVNISSFTNVMTWLANGNVGIGTTSPISRFSNAPSGTNFVGSTNATQSTTGISWLTNSTGYNTSLYNAGTEAGSNGLQVKVANTSPQTIAFEVGQNANLNGTSTSLFNVLGNGNVGIGTNSPSTDLDVVGGFSLRNTVGTAGTNYGIEFNTIPSSPRIDWVYNGQYVGQFASDANNFLLKNSKQSTGGFIFYTKPSDSTLDTERVRIANNGNVGIGTTSPQTMLDISAVSGGSGMTIGTSGTASTDQVNINLGTSYNRTALVGNGNNFGWQIGARGNSWPSPQTNVLHVSYWNGSTWNQAFTVQPGGNFGIGTTAPTAQLHTTGTVRFAGAGTPGAGKVLTSDADGNATWQSTPVNIKQGDYTLTANDSKGVVIMDSNDPVTVTVPATLSAGFFCQIIQKGTGQVTVVEASGVTINSANGTKTRARYSSIGVLMESGTEGYISGDSGL